MSNKRIVIIGNGIAGVTCARHIRKNDDFAEITIISGESEHFFSRTALMYIYMGHMKYEHTKPYEDWFWEKNRIELIFGWVQKVDFEAKEIIFSTDTKTYAYDILILAVGSKPNIMDWKGKNLPGVQGLYSLQDLESMETNSKGIKKAAVVGGGLIGIELVEMLKTRDIDVTFVVREDSFWNLILPPQESAMINRHILEHHVDLRLQAELAEIVGENKLEGIKLNTGETILCEFVGIAIGVRPNIEFLKDSGLEIDLGILIDRKFQTNIEDVYAIGDCAEFRQPLIEGRKKVEQVWYTGRMHGETLARNLTNKNTIPYQPGMWFNSAKFFDIEYQIYGEVLIKDKDGIKSFYWENQAQKVCIRLVYKESDMSLIGVNSLGWRLRHEFFEQAVEGKWTLEKVLVNLEKASFNPEFYKNHHQEVIKSYNEKYQKGLQIKKTSFLSKLIGNRA